MNSLHYIKKNIIKSSLPILVIPVIMILSGCWMSSTKESAQGGVAPIKEEFSITVPKSYTVKQGTGITAMLSLNRDAYFKQDVQLDVKADGLTVSPLKIMVKASEKPEAQIQIIVPREAALGNYKISIKGTPESGTSVSSEFTVIVVPQ